jgi:uncharacterized membrane protein YkvA (DUF1232 family)
MTEPLMSNPAPTNKSKQEASQTLLTHGMTIIEIVREYWRGTYREISAWSMGIITALLAYVVSPIDALPELMMGPFGVLDDALLLGVAIKLINTEITRFNTWKQTKKEPDGNGKIVDV